MCAIDWIVSNDLPGKNLQCIYLVSFMIHTFPPSVVKVLRGMFLLYLADWNFCIVCENFLSFALNQTTHCEP